MAGGFDAGMDEIATSTAATACMSFLVLLTLWAAVAAGFGYAANRAVTMAAD